MKFKNHKGPWGVQNDILYWGDTLEDLKHRPNYVAIEPDKARRLVAGINFAILISKDSEDFALFVNESKRVELSEEYEMLQILLKTVAIGVAPKVTDAVVELVTETVSSAMQATLDFFDSGEEEKVIEKPKTVEAKRTHDTTKLTQYMYDFIIFAYNDWRNYNEENPRRKVTQYKLVDTINDIMGTNKSRTSLARVWTGEIKREDLPKGKAYFEYRKYENAQ